MLRRTHQGQQAASIVSSAGLRHRKHAIPGGTHPLSRTFAVVFVVVRKFKLAAHTAATAAVCSTAPTAHRSYRSDPPIPVTSA